jgi:hypothetical protein
VSICNVNNKQNEGKALEDLGVTNALQRKVLLRNMMFVLLGAHSVPAAPKLSCHVDLSTCSATVFVEDEKEDTSKRDDRGLQLPTNKRRLKIRRGKAQPWEEIDIDGEAVEVECDWSKSIHNT